MPPADHYQPVYALSRGGHLESVHWGAIAVVDASGSLLASLGDADWPIFPRSSLKPFQAMPMLQSGAAQTFAFTPAEIALACASHSGTQMHVQAVAGMLKKIGRTEADLLCGAHPPYHPESAQDLLRSGQQPTALHHNCSGKHTAMLAFSLQQGWDLADYTAPQHPSQLAARQSFARWAALDPKDLIEGVDGCSAANFAAPLRSTALAYARLMDPGAMDAEEQGLARNLRAAMQAHPEMVAGPGRFDTVLMQATEGRILSKGGAEGFQAIGIAAGALASGSPALGLALKIADGDARGWARRAVTIEALRQLGALQPNELQALAAWGPQRAIRNQADLEVGQARPLFDLERHREA